MKIIFALILILSGCAKEVPVEVRTEYIVLVRSHEYKFEFWYNAFLEIADSLGNLRATFYGQIFSRDSNDIIGLRPQASLYHYPSERDEDLPFDVSSGVLGVVGEDLNINHMVVTDTLKSRGNLWHLTHTGLFVINPNESVYYLFGFSVDGIHYVTKPIRSQLQNQILRDG